LTELYHRRIVVCIDSWERTSRYPSGHYVRTIGNIGDKEAETESILIQHDIPYHPFSENVLACLPNAGNVF
jgi:exosome complex exonuclease DIS3/RRP44